MKLSDFILLNEEEKKRVLLHDGVLVGKRHYSGCMVFLFQFPSYYVESYFHLQTKKVEEFRTYTDTGALHAYLEGISISGLLP